MPDIQELLGNPEFRKLPQSEQLKGLSETSPEFGQLPASEQLKALSDPQLGAASVVNIPTEAPGQPGIEQLAHRNNNPGNLMFAGQPGATAGDKGMAKFDDPSKGAAALTAQAQLDASRGHTIESYLSKYAPAAAGNNTEKYIQGATTALGADRTTPLSQLPDIGKLVQFQMKQESGSSFSGPLADPKDPTSALPTAQEAEQDAQAKAKQQVDQIAGSAPGVPSPPLPEELGGPKQPGMLDRLTQGGRIMAGLTPSIREAASNWGSKLFPQLPDDAPIDDKVMTAISRSLVNLASPDSLLQINALGGASEALPALLNLPQVAKIADKIPGLVKALDLTGQYGVNVGVAGKSLKDAWDRGIPQNAQDAMDTGINLLVSTGSLAHAIVGGRAVLEDYPGGKAPTAEETATAAETGGKPGFIKPEVAATKLADLEGQGKNLAASQWRKLADNNPVDLGGGRTLRFSTVEVPGTKPGATPRTRREYQVVDKAGKVLAAGKLGVPAWMNQQGFTKVNPEAGGGVSIGGGVAEPSELATQTQVGRTTAVETAPPETAPETPTAEDLAAHYTDSGTTIAGSVATPEEIQAGAEQAIAKFNEENPQTKTESEAPPAQAGGADGGKTDGQDAGGAPIGSQTNSKREDVRAGTGEADGSPAAGSVRPGAGGGLPEGVDDRPLPPMGALQSLYDHTTERLAEAKKDGDQLLIDTHQKMLDQVVDAARSAAGPKGTPPTETVAKPKDDRAPFVDDRPLPKMEPGLKAGYDQTKAMLEEAKADGDPVRIKSLEGSLGFMRDLAFQAVAADVAPKPGGKKGGGAVASPTPGEPAVEPPSASVPDKRAQLADRLAQMGTVNTRIDELEAKKDQTPAEASELQGLYGKQAELEGKKPVTPAAADAGTPDQQFTAKIRTAIDSNTDIRLKLEKMATEHYGGTRADGAFDKQHIYELQETAMNQWLADNGKRLHGADFNSAVKEIRGKLGLLATQTVRSDEKIRKQQFSTPPQLAYLAGRLLAAGKKDSVLEPSAGTGGLVAGLRDQVGSVHLNEIDPERAALAQEVGFSKPTQHDGEIINAKLPASVKPTRVIMNPPFSSVALKGGGNTTAKGKSKYGYNHVESALQRLAPGGRAVIILGGGTDHNPDQGASLTAPASTEFWKRMASQYHIRANIRIDGKEYAKYGTTFGTRVVVIDKTGPTPGANWLEQLATIERANYPTVEDAWKAVSAIAEAGPGSAATRNREEAGEQKPANGVAGSGERVHTSPPTQPAGSGKTGGATRNPGGRSAAGPDRPKPVHVVDDAQLDGGVQPGARPGERPAPAADGAGESSVQRGDSPDVEPLELEDAPAAAAADDEAGAFATYQPRIKGNAHIGDIVESKSMATVELPPFTYKPSLPADVDISAIQMESVIISGQQNERLNPDGSRGAALIGDGTGVGKGRTIAAILFDNWNKGRRRMLWVSKSWPLEKEARYDLGAVGAGELSTGMKALNKLHKTGKPIEHEGVIFTTYDLLNSKDSQGNTVMALVEHWLNGQDTGETAYIAWDEAHTMKNTVSAGRATASQIGVKTLKLRQALPQVRQTFLSATSATDVVNMGYLERLGLWGPQTPFPAGFNQFVNAIGEGGVAAMELIARELKATGKYVARTLSYRGVVNHLITHTLNTDQRKLYRDAAKAWRDILPEIEKAVQTINGGKDARSAFMNAFWGGHQRFFNLLITALKVPSAIELADKALSEGKAVVITLVNTNEAAQKRQEAKQAATDDEDGEADDLDFGPKDILLDLIKKHYPVQQWADDVDDQGRPIKVLVMEPGPNGVAIASINPAAVAQRDELVKHLEETLRIPENPLDILINQWGRDKVAELTGRGKYYDASKGEFIKRGGSLPRSKVNLDEMRAFQSDEKRVAILSASAGTGISLQAALNVKNQRVRYHITLQPGWSADKAMQMLGRTHRTNQKQGPEYALLASDLSGEKRFTAAIARRLGTLGALTRGSTDASGAGAGMNDGDYFGTQGIAAVTTFGNALLADQPVPGVDDMNGRAILSQMGMLKTNPRTGETTVDGLGNVGRFLNRILALDPDIQNKVFDYFNGIFEAEIQKAIADGTLDTGVKEVKGHPVNVTGTKVIGTDPETQAKTYHYTVDAFEKYEMAPPAELDRQMKRHPDGQFYINTKTHQILFAIPDDPIVHANGTVDEAIRVLRPQFASLVRHAKPAPNSRSQSVELGEYLKAQETKAKDAVDAAERAVETNKFRPPTWREENEPILAGKLTTAREAYAEAAKEATANVTEMGRQMWESEYDAAEKGYSVNYHLIGGAVLRHWNSLSPFVRSSAGGIRLARDTKTGQRVVGVVVPQERIGEIAGQIGGGTVEVSPHQIVVDVLQNGSTYELQGVRVSRGMVSRQSVVRLTPVDAATGRLLIDRFHVRYEKGIQPMYYLPTYDNVGGERVSAMEQLGRIMKDFPLAVKKLAGDEKGSVSLNAATLGLAKFATTDVASMVRGVVETKDDLLNLVTPASRSGDAKAMHGEIRMQAADLQRKADRARAALKKASDYLMTFPAAVRFDFIDRIETGQKQKTPALQAIADIIRAMLDHARDEVQMLGTGKLESFYRDYFPHIWENPKAATVTIANIFARRPIEGRKSFLKQRTIVTIKDGRAAGLVPVSEDPVELVLAKIGEMSKYVMGRRTLEAGKQMGVIKFARANRKPKAPGQWVKIEDPIATVYGMPTPEGSATIRGHYWATPGAAKVFNNYLSPGLGGYAAYRGFRAVGNAMLQFQLGWSAFHAVFVSADAMISQSALGVYQMGHGAKLKGLGNILGGALPGVASVNAFRLGSKIDKAWLRPGTQAPLFEQMADAVVEAGGRAKFDRNLQNNMSKRMMDAFRAGNVIGGLWRAPLALTEQAARPIMEFLIPRMKMGVYAQMARFELERAGPGATPTQVREALQRAWDSVDNRMGQLVYDNLAWNRIGKDLAQISVRTVGWNLGDIRELGGGGSDLGKSVFNKARGREFNITHKTAYLLALPVLAALYGGIVHYLLTGHKPAELLDYYYPGDTDQRVSLPTYIKELVAMTHPLDWAASKIHPLLVLIAEMMTNRDFFKKPIMNSDDTLVEQAQEMAEHVARSIIPISANGIRRDDLTLQQKLLPFFGLPRAPKRIQDMDTGSDDPELNRLLGGR